MEKYNENKDPHKNVFQWDRTCSYNGQNRMIFFALNAGNGACEMAAALREKGVNVWARWLCEEKDIPVMENGEYDNYVGFRANGVVIATGPMIVQYQEFLENFKTKVA